MSREYSLGLLGNDTTVVAVGAFIGDALQLLLLLASLIRQVSRETTLFLSVRTGDPAAEILTPLPSQSLLQPSISLLELLLLLSLLLPSLPLLSLPLLSLLELDLVLLMILVLVPRRILLLLVIIIGGHFGGK